MSVELTEKQKPVYAEIMNYILEIEKEMVIEVDQTNGENIAYTLMRRINLLSTCPKMMSIATAIYDWAKGEAANEAMNSERILGAKQDIQRKWFDGKLAKWNALYVRAERSYKDLSLSIEGLRSLLSYEKNLANLTRVA